MAAAGLTKKLWKKSMQKLVADLFSSYSNCQAFSQGNELFLTKLLVSWSYKEKQNALFELEVLSGIEPTSSPKGGEMKDPGNGSQATHLNNLKGIITCLKTLLCFKS